MDWWENLNQKRSVFYHVLPWRSWGCRVNRPVNQSNEVIWNWNIHSILTPPITSYRYRGITWWTAGHHSQDTHLAHAHCWWHMVASIANCIQPAGWLQGEYWKRKVVKICRLYPDSLRHCGTAVRMESMQLLGEIWWVWYGESLSLAHSTRQHFESMAPKSTRFGYNKMNLARRLGNNCHGPCVSLRISHWDSHPLSALSLSPGVQATLCRLKGGAQWPPCHCLPVDRSPGNPPSSPSDLGVGPNEPPKWRKLRNHG